MKKTYEVEIMGQKFNIKSEEPQAYVDQVVDYISQKMEKIAKTQKAGTLHHAAMLTLLNITDELFKSRVEVDSYKEKVIQKTKNIIQLIDAQH